MLRPSRSRAKRQSLSAWIGEITSQESYMLLFSISRRHDRVPTRLQLYAEPSDWLARRAAKS